jgi:hypothetical protein
MMYLKILEKEGQANPKFSRCDEIIKIWGRNWRKGDFKIIQRINETKIWFFEKINKIDNP